MASMRITRAACLLVCLLPAAAGRRECNAIGQAAQEARCGGGLCGLAQDCVTTVSTFQSYTPPSNCKTSELLASLKSGLRVENACLRPELSVLAGENNVRIQSNGCPDHAYFQDVRVADENSCREGCGTICGSEWTSNDNPDSERRTCGDGVAQNEITAVEPFQPLQDKVACPMVRSACEYEHGLPRGCRADGSSHTEIYADAGGGRRGCGSEGPCGGCWGAPSSNPYCARKEACSAEDAEDEIGPFTPIERAFTFEVPARATVGDARELGAAWEGMVGVAVNGVTIVGHHVHAESGEVETMTMTFDNCGGHGDADNRYHYHIPPMCLMSILGGTVPARGDWWLAAHPESQWPAHATPAADGELSPLLGWAVDGHPIFGPYDPDSGALQVSDGSGCASELDECNGKRLANGVYAYFLTPNYPHVPKCVRGQPGPIVDGAGERRVKCANRGYAPERVSETTACETAPQSLFLEVREERKWVVATAVEGALFLLVGLCLVLAVTPRQLRECAYVQARWVGQEKSIHPDWFTAGVTVRIYRVVFRIHLSLLLVVLLRAAFLLVDPYRMRHLLPRLLANIVYGLVFPCLNLLVVNVLFLLGPLRGLLFTAAKTLVAAQLVVQLTMDGLRSSGQQPHWHYVCQALYAAWGLVLSLAMLVVAVAQRKLLWALAALSSLVVASVAAAALSTSMGDRESERYFGYLNALRVLEAAACALFSALLWDWTRTNRQRAALSTVPPDPVKPSVDTTSAVRVPVPCDATPDANRSESTSSGRSGAGAVVGSMVHAVSGRGCLSSPAAAEPAGGTDVLC